MVLLRRHVQRSEAVLTLSIDVGSGFQQLPGHIQPPGEAGDVESCVALLCSRVHLTATIQQLLHDVQVAFLGCQVQGVESVLERGRIDVCYLGKDNVIINGNLAMQTNSINRSLRGQRSLLSVVQGMSIDIVVCGSPCLEVSISFSYK